MAVHQPAPILPEPLERAAEAKGRRGALPVHANVGDLALRIISTTFGLPMIKPIR